MGCAKAAEPSAGGIKRQSHIPIDFSHHRVRSGCSLQFKMWLRKWGKWIVPCTKGSVALNSATEENNFNINQQTTEERRNSENKKTIVKPPIIKYCLRLHKPVSKNKLFTICFLENSMTKNLHSEEGDLKSESCFLFNKMWCHVGIETIGSALSYLFFWTASNTGIMVA